MRLHLPTPLRRALLAAIVTVSALSYSASATSMPELTIVDTEENDFYTDVETANLSGLTAETGATGTITGTGADATVFNARGMILNGTDTSDGTVSAFQFIRLGSQTIESDMEFHGNLLVNDGGGISADYAGSVHVTGNVGADSGANVEVADSMQMTVDGEMLTENGSLSVIGTDSVLNLTTAQELTNTALSSEGLIDTVGLSTTGGTTRLTGANAVLHGSEGDIAVSGVTTIEEGALMETVSGDITLHGATYLSNASVDAGEGTLRILTSEADYVGSMTTIRNAALHADEAVLLQGEAGNRATVTGASSITSDGTTTVETLAGVTREVGMVFSDVQFESLSNPEDVVATDGDILLQSYVSLKDATLATAGTTEESRGEIIMDRHAVLELKSGAEIDSRLSSEDTTAAIMLTDAYNLTVSEDSRDYKGRILATAEDGSQITVASVGLGEEARSLLKDSNFTVTAEAYEGAEPVQVGSINTALDSGARNNEAGTLDTFLIDGSYTADDNTRAGYREIGSILNFDRGTAGTETLVTNLRLNPYTLLWEDISLNEDGSVTADKMTLSGDMDPNGARVFATLGESEVYEAAIADGTSVLFAEGAMAPGSKGFNENVLYDMELTENGTYQRVLRTLNVHVVNDAEQGASLVFSNNFRSAAQNGNQAAVAGALSALADTVDHTEGTLAAMDTDMARLLDALDYTRSGADAAAALQALSGAGNTIAQLSAMDATSHHLDTLRSRVTMPTPCTWDKGGYHMPERLNDAWAVYEGGYDHIDGQAGLGDYSRTFQGLLLGYDRQICCNATLGIAFGYENSIARSSGTRVEDDAYYIDLYSGVRTGRFDHKFTFGVGLHDYDSSRSYSVNAPGHDYSARCSGSMDGISIHAGYELSYEYELRNNALLTPYLDVNYAYIDLDSLSENGGAGSVTTSYDSMNLVQVALGARYEKRFAGLQHQERGTVTFSAQAVGDFCDRRPSASNRFNSLDPTVDSFRINSLKRAPFYGQLGMNVVLPLSTHWDMIGGVYGRLGHNIGSVSGNVGLRYDF